MKQITAYLPEMKLVGITARTGNAVVFASDPQTNPIAKTIQRYVQEGLAERIKSRKNPGTTLCVFTQYEIDFMGEYYLFYW